MTVNNKRNIRKRMIALGLALVVVLGIIIGAVQYVNYRNDQKTITVVPAYYALDTYWGGGGSSTSEGTIVSDYVQELYPESAKTISEIFVSEGQEVHVGDPLLQYDRTSLELDVEAKEIAQKQVQVRIDEAQRILKKLQNTKAYSTPAPTKKPTVTSRPTATPKPTARPTATPKPTATPVPTPTPFPTPDQGVVAYKELDVDSIPYKGFGTSESPYVFLCQEGFTMTPEFLRLLLGLESEPVVTPDPTTPEPSETDEPGDTVTPAPDDSAEPSGSGDDTPDSQPQAIGDSEPDVGSAALDEPEDDSEKIQLRSPFAGIFEVREHDSNYGKLISSFTLDGTKMSAAFNLPGLVAGSNAANTATSNATATVRNEVESQYKMATPTPKPTPEPNNYNHMNYTATVLAQLIKEKKREITNLQHDMKQAQLNLEIAQQTLSNSTVTSNLDGIVSRLTDIDSAMMEGKPFLVVSGAQQYYISSSINESMIGQVNVGDIVSFMSYGMDGMSNYTAQIVSISDYPLTGNRYYDGETNPNSSNYEFTAVILDPDDAIQTGNWGQVTLEANSQPTDIYGEESKYLRRAYYLEDDSGPYVMIAGKDNRLHKQYVRLGKMYPWGGDSFELLGGMTQDDFIAFPYSADAKEGVRVILEDTKEPPYPDGSEEEDTNADSSEPQDDLWDSPVDGIEPYVDDGDPGMYLDGNEDGDENGGYDEYDGGGAVTDDGGGDAVAMPASPGYI